MDHLVLMSHGEMCIEMKKSAEMIMGEQENIHAIPFYSNEGPEDLAAKLKDLTADFESFTVFTDLYGGTPNNVAAKELMNGADFELISGMNLSMVISFVNAGFTGEKPDYVAEATQNINNVGEMLKH